VRARAYCFRGKIVAHSKTVYCIAIKDCLSNDSVFVSACTNFLKFLSTNIPASRALTLVHPECRPVIARGRERSTTHGEEVPEGLSVDRRERKVPSTGRTTAPKELHSCTLLLAKVKATGDRKRNSSQPAFQ